MCSEREARVDAVFVAEHQLRRPLAQLGNELEAVPRETSDRDDAAG